MIFALSTDDRTLKIFPIEAEAISYCECIDVENGLWRFFDENGEALKAVFTKPSKRGSFWVESDAYILRHSANPQKPLLDVLDEVVTVEGAPPLNTVAEVKKLLTSRSKSTP